MRDTSLRDLSDDAIENELKDPHISKERKAQLQREQKARGLRNRRKRAGYNHHFAPIDMIN